MCLGYPEMSTSVKLGEALLRLESRQSLVFYYNALHLCGGDVTTT